MPPPRAPRGCRAVAVAGADGSLWHVLLGKCAEANDRLSLEEGRPYETWMHVADVPGSHVVVRHICGGAGERAPPPRDVAEAAAGLCAFHSKARAQSRATVHVTTCDMVGKQRKAPPGMVELLGDYDTLSVRPLSPDQLAQDGAVAAVPSRKASAEAKRNPKTGDNKIVRGHARAESQADSTKAAWDVGSADRLSEMGTKRKEKGNALAASTSTLAPAAAILTEQHTWELLTAVPECVGVATQSAAPAPE